jgi:hypothetical protein
MEVTIRRHCVESDPESGLSTIQKALLDHPAKVRIASAPTGAGKSYAFERAMERGERVLFMVPTRRLAQNLLAGLAESLLRRGWEDGIVVRKLAEWSSDETKRLRNEGLAAITPRRIREMFSLYPFRDEGEMIVAIPESLSHILLREHRQRGQTDAGVFSVLMNFEHIVFDEFHTISTRGFGLAGLMAKLAATMEGVRAKVSFLSATPFDIGPVLRRLDVPDDQIVELREIPTQSGRVIHGDVRLVLEDAPSMVRMVRDHIHDLKRELGEGRQVVIIYDALHDLLLRQKSEMEAVLRETGVSHRRALIINSISDSTSKDLGNDFFAVGREHRLETFDVLISTASVEMGVTFRANLLFMEPGFEPMNFLQRYGRAARGNHNGQVFVRWDGEVAARQPWLRELRRWIEEHNGYTMEIDDLAGILSKSARLRFEEPREEDGHFGRLPIRAAYAAGLYWNVIMAHWSNRGARWKHLRKHQPKPAALVHALLQEVRSMERDPIFGRSAKKWCDGFEAQAPIMRDVGARIRVIDGEGLEQFVSLLWLQRYTDILSRFPLGFSVNDGLEEVVIDGKLEDWARDRRHYVPAMRSVRFPHTPFPAKIPDNASLVDVWCRQFSDRSGSEGEAWQECPEAMEAAKRLVRLTGLVVTDEEVDVGSSNCIL